MSSKRQFALLFLPVLLLATMGWQRRWTSDDGFINLRIVRQIEAGNGPTFNADERVEAATSPLWVGLLTLLDLASPFRLEANACALALCLSLVGLACAILGTQTLARATGSRSDVLLPLGALVFAALPPAWDFATSGLENGLASAWLGSVWLALASRAVRSPVSPLRPFWLPILVGLGPLVRPDCAIETGIFALLLVVSHERPASWRSLAAVLCAAAPSLVVTFLRMGYYASLVPNTALAKEASLAYWSQGWRYFVDFTAPYGLALPLIVTLAIFVLPDLLARGPVQSLRLAALVAAFFHLLFVTRVGGDFMHGRMLLLPLSCALLPATAVPVRGKRWVAAAVVVAWAVLCTAVLRLPYPGQVGKEGIADERGFYVALSGRANPVTSDDYHDSGWWAAGDHFRTLARDGHRTLVLNTLTPFAEYVPLRNDLRCAVYVSVPVIGLIGFVAGSDIHIVDVVGLADPIVARSIVQQRGRPGHEKHLAEAWHVARYASDDVSYPDAGVMDQVRLAREALACPSFRELEDAIAAPLTSSRFFANVRAAPRLTVLRIPSDPAQAVAALCPR